MSPTSSVDPLEAAAGAPVRKGRADPRRKGRVRTRLPRLAPSRPEIRGVHLDHDR